MKSDGRGVDAPVGTAPPPLDTADNASRSAGSLLEALALKRGSIVKEWLTRTTRSYPEHASRFLSREKDPFRNPVGHTYKLSLPILYNHLLGDKDHSRLAAALDDVIRIRAVQDFTASQAVSFVFLLKEIIREVLHDQLQKDARQGWESLETAIDDMALLAFDLYVKCREKMIEVRVNEVKRKMYLLERLHSASGSGELEDNREASAQRLILKRGKGP